MRYSDEDDIVPLLPSGERGGRAGSAHRYMPRDSRAFIGRGRDRSSWNVSAVSQWDRGTLQI